jgi:hypothetical protein
MRQQDQEGDPDARSVVWRYLGVDKNPYAYIVGANLPPC